MEEHKKIRNHISIVLEEMGAVAWIYIVLFITNLDDVLLFFEEGLSSDSNKTSILVAGIAFGVFLIASIYQLIVWSKTYISICNQSIVIERNTWNKRKNTIGIRNISNVNTEQNLLEMFLGTCKVKMDTNSMSTAEETDIKIVLKKEEAEAFRKAVMKLMRQCEGGTESEEEEQMEWDFQVNSSDIFAHGIFSINILSVVVAIASLIGIIGMTIASIKKVSAGGSIVGAFVSFVVAGGMCISAFRDILKGFIRYYDFKMARKGNKLYMNYGLFKKVNYAIPIEKINGLILKQSLIGRMSGRYMAEIINIGMGDDEVEKESFLFPYAKKEIMEERIRQFIPELAEAMDLSYEKQPKATWIAWLWPMFLYGLLSGSVVVAFVMYSPKHLVWEILGVIVTSLFFFFLMIMKFFTCGSLISERYLVLVDGFFGKSYCFLPYRKVQHVTLKQNVFAKWMKIQKAEVYLLASAMNRVKTVPYFEEKKVVILRDRILNGK